jgi:sRNA-binding regulator protein Hfq
MAKSVAQLKIDTDALINTNGVNGISAALHNVLLNEILDSLGDNIGVNTIKVGPGGKTIANGAIKGSGKDYFSDIDEAFDIGSNGDLMIVSGDRNCNRNLGGKNIKYIFNGRPIVTGLVNMWDDLNAPGVVFDVSGDADFRQPVAGQNNIRIQAPTTVFKMNCYGILGAGSVVVYWYGGTSDSFIKTETKIDSNLVNWTVRIGADAKGTIYSDIDCNTVAGGTQNAFNIGSYNNDVLIVGDIYNNSPLGQNTFTMNDTTKTGTITIQGDIYENPNVVAPSFWTDNIIFLLNGNLTILGDIVGNVAGSDKYALSINSGSGNKFIHKGKMVNHKSKPLTRITGSQEVTLDGDYESTGNSIAIETAQTGGFISINGNVKNSSNLGAASYGVKLGTNAGYEAIFLDTKIVVDDLTAPVSIEATAAKNILIYKHVLSNIDKNANATDLIGAGGFAFNSNVK